MKLLGGIMIAAGILVAGAGGLCTWLVTTSGDPRGIDVASLFQLGLLPIAAGLAMIVVGTGLSRHRDEA